MPLIGIVPAVNEERDSSVFYPYIYCIERAGGTPVVLPFVERVDTLLPLLEICDGFLFIGGIDVEPCRYGEDPLPACGATISLCDDHGFRIFEAVRATGKPILGICRGAQLINVAMGGTLYQDLPTQAPSDLLHRQQEEKFEFSHEVLLTEDAPLHSLIGKDRIRGNSFHHQAVKDLGKGLAVMAHAADGVIEAIYAPDHPFLWGIQWHPERLCDKSEDNQAIFDRFLSLCK